MAILSQALVQRTIHKIFQDYKKRIVLGYLFKRWQKPGRRALLVLPLLWMFWPGFAYTATHSDVASSSDPGSVCDDSLNCSEPKTKEVSQAGWIDRRHTLMSNQADALARWLDGFFGVPRSDLEAAHSRLRVRLAHHLDEIEASDTDIGVRGKLFLPRINKRLSLLFSDQELNEFEDSGNLDGLTRPNEDNSSVGLQYNFWNKIQSRLDFNLGVRSGLEPRTSVRYRQETPIQEIYLARFSQELFVRAEEGVGSVARVDLDRALSNSRLLRFANRFEFGENSDGLEWGIRVSQSKRLGGEQGVSYFTFINGETRPEELTTSYGLGVLYRINFFRSWLFAELEPSYAWRRDEPGDSREGAARLTLRLEVALDTED